MTGASVPHARDNISDLFVLTGTLLPQRHTEPPLQRERERETKGSRRGGAVQLGLGHQSALSGVRNQ